MNFNITEITKEGGVSLFKKNGDYNVYIMTLHIMQKYPEARNSDFDLIQLFFWEYFNATTLLEVSLIHIPITSIIRYRALIQSKGQYPAVESIKKCRSDLERKTRREMSAEIHLDRAHNRKLSKMGLVTIHKSEAEK